MIDEYLTPAEADYLNHLQAAKKAAEAAFNSFSRWLQDRYQLKAGESINLDGRVSRVPPKEAACPKP